MRRSTLTDLGLPRAPLIIGHRGACGHAPENTMPSFSLAVEALADMIELDLHLTGDGELVASHDCDLTRTAGLTTNVELTDYPALRDINVAMYFGDYPATTIPRLDDVLEVLPPHLPVNLELKCVGADHRRYVDVLRTKLNRDGILISSFNWNLLREVRRHLPQIAIAPLADENAPELPAIARELDATSAHCNWETVTRPIVSELRDENIPVLVYTVNDIGVAERMLAMGVRGVFTNFPAEFVAHFGPPENRRERQPSERSDIP